MRYHTLTGTDVRVSELGFGVWTVATSWWGAHTDEDAIAMLHRAYEHGVTFFDTADTYGEGRGETLLAAAFPGAERDRIVIGTKFGYDWQNRTNSDQTGHVEAPHCMESAFLEQALHASLERLGTDHIDIWQFHNPDLSHLQRDDVWTFLERARREGKVRSVGVALGPAIGWLEEGVFALEQCPVESVHIIYNALELDPGRALIDAARRTNKTLLVRVPHSSGMLEGRYSEETVFPASDHRSHRPRAWLVNGLKKVEQLGFLTDGTDRTIGQAAMRFVLREPEVVSALPNIYDLEQLEEFAAAAACADITDAEASRIEALFDQNYGLPREREAGTATRAGVAG